MILTKYGTGRLFSTALLDAEETTPGLLFESAPAIAAGDFKRVTDLLALGNLTAEFAAFTSGSVAPSVGDTITGATSTETAVVIGFYLTSGTWAGGDAAGTVFVEQVSGAWQAENVNNTTTASTNDFTLSADYTPSIGAQAAGTVIWFALTSAEMTCKQGQVQIVDAADGPVWAADGIVFETYGNAAAMHPYDLDQIATIAADVAGLNGGSFGGMVRLG